MLQLPAGRSLWVILDSAVAVQIDSEEQSKVVYCKHTEQLHRHFLPAVFLPAVSYHFDGPKLWIIAGHWFDSNGRRGGRAPAPGLAQW